jgi:hypothetical protein
MLKADDDDRNKEMSAPFLTGPITAVTSPISPVASIDSFSESRIVFSLFFPRQTISGRAP